MNRKYLFISVSVVLVLVFMAAALLYQAASTGGWGSATPDATQRQGAPLKGPADAKVTIVEFLDPACGTCRDFYPLVSRFVDQYPGQVRVMVRYAPLHAGSDEVVTMLEAAHRQGRFWPALELLFSNQLRWVVNHRSQPERARSLLNALDVDQQRLSSDIEDPDVRRVIQRDIADGKTLGVRATPGFFVNGRPLTEFGYQQLKQLVADAVAREYK